MPETAVSETDEQLAKQIAAVSSLSYETALEALRANGRTRKLVMSILESKSQYERDLQQISDARQRLRGAVAA